MFLTLLFEFLHKFATVVTFLGALINLAMVFHPTMCPRCELDRWEATYAFVDEETVPSINTNIVRLIRIVSRE